MRPRVRRAILSRTELEPMSTAAKTGIASDCTSAVWETDAFQARCYRRSKAMVYLTRKAEFSAAHYYHNPQWSKEENERAFGKCANLNGHGHNYTLEVPGKGNPGAKAGFVIDLKGLKTIMHHEVLDVMDHRMLNKEVAEF